MPPPPRSPAVSSPGATPLQYLKGVGPQRAKALARLGLSTVEDLLFHFPRTHEDRRFAASPESVVPGTRAALVGTVRKFEVSSAGRDLSLGRAVLEKGGPLPHAGTAPGGGRRLFEAVWFRRKSFRFDPFDGMKKSLADGVRVAVFGDVQRGPLGFEVRVEDHEVVPPGESLSPHMGRWTPVYDLTDRVNGRWLRGLTAEALRRWSGQVADPLPRSLRDRHGLADLGSSLAAYHFPESLQERDRARRRLAFDEFFILELALAAARRDRAAGPPAPPCVPTRALLTPFRNRLGFEFTPAQKRVINEIFADMAEPRPMSRLLMGDVGSGKTAVALSALLLAVENGFQAALMAPTEILAEQHALGLSRLLADLPVRWALFTGGRPAAQKRRDREALARGDLHIAVGTHALLQEGVKFHRLGLAVIDEQHRFGVAQRGALSAKALSPHVLLMTATPIPRTLAMTLYGDLSVSVIDQLPPGRPGILTRWSPEGAAWAAVRRAAAQGRQAYVVFPLVETSERLDLRAVMDGWRRLKEDVFPEFTVGLLHGRMKSRDKEAAMARFAAGDLHILCATPVVEVGLDVPNATVLVVLNAERFGLAQLHQLRGRVGRGRFPSECHLISHVRSPGPLGTRSAAEAEAGGAAERLRLLCAESSGFRLAEEDLKRRGPGEFLGEAQHGLPALKAGNLVTDGPLIEEARREAFDLLEKDPALAAPEHRPLAQALRDRFAEKLNLGRVA